MLSTTHTTMDLAQWLQDFEVAYRNLYGFKAPFPRPPIVHSDGSLVFQLAAMRFFNATNEDLSKTVVHSCFAHFSKGVKRQATKFFAKKKVAFALWIMSLLVNSNTVEKMASMWEHTCTVLLSPTQNTAYSVSISCLSYAADNVNNDPDKDNFIIRNVKVDSKGEYQYSSTLGQIIGSNIDDDDTENSISEQNACDESESPFRDYFTSVFNDQKTKCAMFANENFQKYNENPYYNPDYLKCILSLYLSVAPIWSNLLMGNLGRYGYRNFEPIQHCGCHNSRTTGISESRLKVIKHTVLQGEVSSRIDQVVQILGSNIRQAEINYSNHYLLNLTRNRSMRAKKLLAEEPWNKRGPPAVTTTSIYSQKPKVSLVAQVKKALKIKSKADDVVVVSTGKNTFQFKPHPMLSQNQLSWLNSSIQLALSNSCLIETLLNNFCSSSNAHNSANNPVTIVSDIETNNTTHLNWYPKVEQITIQYLCDIFKSPCTKPLGITIVDKYIGDLRKHGPKMYIVNTQEHIPIIQPIGQMSSVKDYLSNVLLHAMHNFIDVPTIFNESCTCSQCHVENEKNVKTCNACGKESDQNQYRRDIVQLPDTLFMALMPKKYRNNSNDNVLSTEFFIQNYLNMFTYAYPQLVCYPSYFKYQLKSIIVSTEKQEDNNHYYIFATYGEQFYRCDDSLIEPVDKALVFERKNLTTIAMYVREQNKNANFAATIGQILFETGKYNVISYGENSHVRMMFDAALEYISGNTKLLSWSYGAVYTCLQCKDENHVFGRDCILFSNDKHVSKSAEISLDDTLLQAKLAPKIRCRQHCEGYTFTRNANYSILEIPTFVFVTFTVNSAKNSTKSSTTDKSNESFHKQIYVTCDLTQSCFNYDLYCFIVVTKDDRTLFVKLISNNEYSVYNNDTKAYEPLLGYHFNNFIIASATNIVLCYKTNDDLDLFPTFQPITLDIHDWKEKNNLYSFILADAFNTYMYHRDKPFKMGPYELNPTDIFNLIEPKYELNDQLLNAHLYKTTTLTTGIVLFDSVSFLKYCLCGFRTTAEIIDTQWFNNDIVLVPIHNSRHWILFIIDIKKKTIVFLDSLPSNSSPYENINIILFNYFEHTIFIQRNLLSILPTGK
ncbi:unnamed protein product [Rotaria socialis]|uniref:Ubiquitin-like protease family profile domain-containing protein n=2 Tax=Rotaria socialis TaxID=392032 RepID=A0A820IVQ6_9BILA|nr:unnamed protein product [Rotaria socialis]